MFVWSAHRHRYETAHIEKNLVGFSPVLLQSVSYSTGKGKSVDTDDYSGFSVCVQNKEGQLVRRQYPVLSNLIRFAGEGPCVLPPPVDFNSPSPPSSARTSVAQVQQPSLWQRLKNRLKSLRGGK